MSVPATAESGAADLERYLSQPRRSAGRALYLALEPDPVFAMLHGPSEERRRTTGVLVGPAFGWDEICSHRSVRALADVCAAAGLPTLRIDLPGSGDSGGSPLDPGRFDSWLAAVSAGASMLREHERCDRVVAFGIGLGGMLSCLAVAGGAAIDDLVVWAVPSRGARMLRELRALGGLVAAIDQDEGAAASVDRPDRGMHVAGFALSAETVSRLEALDLRALTIPDASRRRVLLVGRDGPPDAGLVEAFTSSGAQVSVDDGVGFAGMMTDPVLSVVPAATLAAVRDWLAQTPDGPGRGRPAAPTVRIADTIELSIGEEVIRERPFTAEHRGLQLSGVFAEPVSATPAGICAVLLNAGSARRIGPNRMWVDNARPWVARGVPVLRLDMLTIGDSDGEEHPYKIGDYYQDDFRLQVLAALDALEQRGFSRFLLCGLCSGSYWSLHSALSDERIRALLLLNTTAIYWSAGVGVMRDIRRAGTLLRERQLGMLVKLLVTQRWRMVRLTRTMLGNTAKLGRGGATQMRFDAQIASAFDKLRESGVDVTFFFGQKERLYDDFAAAHIPEQLDRWPNIRIERMLTRSHVLRGFAEQAAVAAVLAGAVARLADLPQRDHAQR